MLARRTLITAFTALGLGLGLGLGLCAALPAFAADAALESAVAGSWRDAANRLRDSQRHPVESLTFWGLAPGMTVVEMEPGARGWWTEILAPYARATGGSYIALLADRTDPALNDQARANRENGHKAFWAEVSDTSIFGTVSARDFGLKNVGSVPAGSADLVLVARAFHNWVRQGDATDVYLKGFYDMLKPGGVLAVEQHRAPEGADSKAGTGYVPESYVIAAAQKAGFILEGRSEINANPKDTRDHPFGVWTLPPTRKSSDNSRTLSEAERAQYDAIGESDRMTLRFKKP